MRPGVLSARLAAALAVFSVASLSHVRAQGPPASTVKAGSVKQGAILFRQECVFCHGVGARGGMRGPDLTAGTWTHGGSDVALTRTIQSGVPGTAMPPNQLTKEEVTEIIAYLRSVQQPSSAPTGNATAGEQLFFGNASCSTCHMVNGRGGRLGPDLSRIGSARPRAHLIESIRDPDRQITENLNFISLDSTHLRYDTVIAVTETGETIRGVPLNEDTFTLQVMDKNEKIFSFDKRSLKSFRHEPTSLMPAYSPDALSERDLLDIVAYLQSLRTAPDVPRKGGSSDQK
jgi:cytochrome c oxidase cbb3-type subunit III